VDQLIITVLYPENTEITQALIEQADHSQCQLIDVRVSRISNTYLSALLVLSGNWSQLTRFQTHFALLKEQYHFTGTIQAVKASHYPPEGLPYNVYILMPASASTLYKTLQFFLDLPVILQELVITSYQAPMTQTTMKELNIVLITSPEKPLSTYRESIFHFCDENNLEIILESKRN
jgi:glycine cleavage system regulatory protein